MKKLILGLFLVSNLAQAEDFAVTVKNFNFTYQDPHGEGVATSFSRTKRTEEVKVLVEKVENAFKLNVSGAENEEFEFKDAPSFLTEAQTMTVKNFNLSLNQALSLSVTQGRFQSSKDELKLDGLSLNCQREASHPEVMDQLVAGCMKKMSLKSSKFSSSDAENLMSLVAQSVILAANEGKGITSVGVNSVDLETTNGKYDLTAEVKAQVSGKVKSHGNMGYDPQTGKVTLKISQVKFSFFDITSKVFDELKKQESDKLKVKEPYVYYTIK